MQNLEIPRIKTAILPNNRNLTKTDQKLTRFNRLILRIDQNTIKHSNDLKLTKADQKLARLKSRVPKVDRIIQNRQKHFQNRQKYIKRYQNRLHEDKNMLINNLTK